MIAEVWIRIEATQKYNRWVAGPVHAFKSKPTTEDNQIAVKVSIEIPDAIFEEPVYEAKLILPNVTKKFPEMSEVLRGAEKALTERMGFKIKLEVPQPEEIEDDIGDLEERKGNQRRKNSRDGRASRTIS